MQSAIEARVAWMARGNFVIPTHHVQGGTGLVVGTRVGTASTGVCGVLPEAMFVAIVHGHITHEGDWHGIGDESGGSGERVSWGRGRDDGSLICTVVARGLSGELSESLLVFKVDVCCEVQQGMVGERLVSPLVNSRREDTCTFEHFKGKANGSAVSDYNNNKSYLYPATGFVNSRNPFQDGCVDIYLSVVAAPSGKTSSGGKLGQVETV